MRPRAFPATLATAAAALLALGGCSGSGTEAGPTPPPQSSINATTATPITPAPAPSPTAAPTYQPATENGPAQNVPVPVMPETAKEFSKEGLIAFTEYWYNTLGYAHETGDTVPIQAISDPSCLTCTNIMSKIEERYSDGGWLVGGQMQVHNSSSSFVQTPEGTYQAIATIQQMKVTSYDPDGTVESESTQMIARPDIVVAKYVEKQWSALTAEHLTSE